MPKYAWMKACLTGICCCLLLAGCGEKQGSSDRGLMRLPEEAAAFQQEDRVAVIVGIDAYAPESNFRPLNYAVADATALKVAFEKHGYKVKLLADGQAKKHFILQAIQEAGKLLEPEKGTLVFAFTGHGFAGKTTEGEDENFLAVDGTTDYDLARSGLGLEEVKTALKATKARRNMVFIDACRDNPLKDRDKSKAFGINPGFAELAASEGLNVLYSTAPGDVSVELPEFQHGLFTHFLLDGLDGKAAQNGLVLFDGLADYVTKQVKNYSFEKLPQTQKPYRSGESSGQFLVATLPNYQPEIASPAAISLAQQQQLTDQPLLTSPTGFSAHDALIIGNDSNMEQIDEDNAENHINNLSKLFVDSCPSKPNTDGLNLLLENATRMFFSGAFLFCKGEGMTSTSEHQQDIKKIHNYVAQISDSDIANIINYIRIKKWLPHKFISQKLQELRSEIKTTPHISVLYSEYKDGKVSQAERDSHGRILDSYEELSNGNNATLVQKFIFRQGGVIKNKLLLAIDTYLHSNLIASSNINNKDKYELSNYFNNCISKSIDGKFLYTSRISLNSYKKFVSSTGWVTSHDLYGLSSDEGINEKECEEGGKEDIIGINLFSAIAYSEWISQATKKPYHISKQEEIKLILNSEKTPAYTRVNIESSISNIKNNKTLTEREIGYIFDDNDNFGIDRELSIDSVDIDSKEAFVNNYYYNAATNFRTFRLVSE